MLRRTIRLRTIYAELSLEIASISLVNLPFLDPAPACHAGLWGICPRRGVAGDAGAKALFPGEKRTEAAAACRRRARDDLRGRAAQHRAPHRDDLNQLYCKDFSGRIPYRAPPSPSRGREIGSVTEMWHLSPGRVVRPPDGRFGRRTALREPESGGRGRRRTGPSPRIRLRSPHRRRRCPGRRGRPPAGSRPGRAGRSWPSGWHR